MFKKSKTAVAALTLALLVSALSAGPAMAAKGGGSRGGGAGTATGSLSLVLLNSTDGLPHYGQQVTFSVSSTAAYPFVQLDCYQDGVWVYDQTVGYYPGWPGFTYFTLRSAAWTGGGASCTAVLYSQYSDGSNRQNLASTSFQVYP